MFQFNRYFVSAFHLYLVINFLVAPNNPFLVFFIIFKYAYFKPGVKVSKMTSFKTKYQVFGTRRKAEDVHSL